MIVTTSTNGQMIIVTTTTSGAVVVNKPYHLQFSPEPEKKDDSTDLLLIAAIGSM